MNSRRTEALAPLLDPEKLPCHVAMIMDGNGRWAKKRLMNRVNGHEKGAETVRTVVRTSRELGIRYLTLYAFSTENWQRPRTEVSALMALLKRFLKAEERELVEREIRLNVIGQTERLPDDVRQVLAETIRATGNGNAMTLNLALSYGGRSEILEMAKRIAQKVKNGDLNPEDITHEMVAAHLYTAGMPDPDLLIRTSGEMRISNFLLWQIAYSEIFITETFWPDFSKEEYLSILEAFQRRDRRFGKTDR